MSSTEKEISPKWTRGHFGEEASSQSTLIIHEPLPTTPAVHHQRSGLRSRPRHVARLARELATVAANMRAISPIKCCHTRTARPYASQTPPVPLSQPHLFDPPSVGGQHGQPQLEGAIELAHRYMHPPPRNMRERRAALA
ncbi:Hypothetical predicted protein [Olea europaea subsp. europaea]|uniref:Uncharacterized protein n=1 Tax=Olea europaea subsp. europaea TaxID=158383 RepID=A0A8S0S557_OLEEU|nr:Hypothetical predicted protein [Olea europaea subsp. europaea]